MRLVLIFGWETWAIRGDIADILEKLGCGRLGYLISDLRHPTMGKEAAIELGELGDKRAVESLIESLRDEEDYRVRENIVDALGRIGDKKAVEPLIEHIHDEEYGAGYYAIKALGKFGDKKAVEPLIKVLQDEKGFIRRTAAEALGDIGDKRAVEPLMRVLQDEEVNVRQDAAEALGKLGDKRAVLLLRETLQDEYDYERRESVAIALGKLGDISVIPVLEDIISGRSWGKEMARQALGEIKASPLYLKWRQWEPKLKKWENEGYDLSEIKEKCYETPEQMERELGEVGKRIERRYEASLNNKKKRELEEESKEVSSHPQTINIGSIGEVLGAGAVKTGDVGMVKGGIGSTEKPFSNCPHCGEALNLPKTPKFCPYCGGQMR